MDLVQKQVPSTYHVSQSPTLCASADDNNGLLKGVPYSHFLDSCQVDTKVLASSY